MMKVRWPEPLVVRVHYLDGSASDEFDAVSVEDGDGWLSVSLADGGFCSVRLEAVRKVEARRRLEVEGPVVTEAMASTVARILAEAGPGPDLELVVPAGAELTGVSVRVPQDDGTERAEFVKPDPPASEPEPEPAAAAAPEPEPVPIRGETEDRIREIVARSPSMPAKQVAAEVGASLARVYQVFRKMGHRPRDHWQEGAPKPMVSEMRAKQIRAEQARVEEARASGAVPAAPPVRRVKVEIERDVALLALMAARLPCEALEAGYLSDGKMAARLELQDGTERFKTVVHPEKPPYSNAQRRAFADLAAQSLAKWRDEALGVAAEGRAA